MPALPLIRTSGVHGTAILWKDNIDHCIEPVMEGGDRICAIKINSKQQPLLLLNTYMSTQGCLNSSYDQVLTEVEAIITRHGECIPIWTGDINASICRERPTSNDAKFSTFCKENKLQVSAHMPRTPTFHHTNGQGGTSCIDLFIQRTGEEPISNIFTRKREALNTGDHDPVIATVRVRLCPPPDPKLPGEPGKKPPRRVRWDKMDKVQYRDATHIQLTALLSNIDGLPTAIITQRLNKILTNCATQACPPPPQRKRTTKFRWCAKFKPLANDVRQAYREYRTPGLKIDQLNIRLTKLKAAKRILRKAQRQSAAKRRVDINSAIINACHRNDRQEVYKLMKRQRKPQDQRTTIDFGEHTTNSHAESWARYYADLATPQDDHTFDADHRQYLEVNYLLQSLTADSIPIPPIDINTVQKHIKFLKNNKAPDIHGIASEHVKLASTVIANIIQHLINDALTNGHLPDIYKIGLLNPVPKKAKSRKMKTNYRRITITSIIGKVVELHLMTHSRPPLDRNQSMAQFGFTHGCSPVLAAVVLTEVIAEARDNNQQLIVSFMDTSKAFDVVSHKALLNSLHQQDISGVLWKAYESMYSNIKSVVKWQDELSDPFSEQQGIRQGGSSSADKYKAGKNRLLERLEYQRIHNISHINTGAVMVADDLALMSTSPYDMQVGLSIAQHDAAREQYKFNTDKTKYIIINPKQPITLELNGKPLGNSTKETHLGIVRNSSCTNMDTINDRIKKCRGQIFDLLNAGYRGYNGAGPQVTVMQYTTCIMSTLLYGLDALVLSKDEIKLLSDFHRQNLRCIQHLPKATAIAAIHLLTGVLPIEAIMDTRTLTLFRSAIDDSTECPPLVYTRKLIAHQITMKDNNSTSWAVHVRKLLAKYSLPPASNLLAKTPSKKMWKDAVKKAVYKHWTSELCEDALTKSTLSNLNLEMCQVNRIHPTWLNLSSPLAVKQATIRTLLLVQRYPLTSSPTAGTKRCDTCPLCHSEPETLTHFILHCQSLSPVRLKFLIPILEMCRSNHLSIDPNHLIKIILDSTHLPFASPEHDERCRKYIFTLHNERSIMLGGEPQYKC